MKQEHDGQARPWETLDPEDWEQIRAIGHSMLDDMVDYVRDVRDQPAWQSPSKEARESLASPLPRAGRPLHEVYDQFKRSILPYPTGNIHPRFWGWVMGNGTPVGMLAELLGGAMNCHVSGYDQGATLVERQVVQWLIEIMEFPANSTGLLVSGGTVANLLGITVARNHALGDSVRSTGVGRHQAVVYCSDQTHGWVDRSADLLGLGEATVRKLPTDACHRIQLESLRDSITSDRRAGRVPVCVVGNAGTVSCGATDDLSGLADLAEQEGLWFHIDGAFGALAKLSPRHRHFVAGLERADSVAFDLHKWGYMQYEIGVVLFRDGAAHDGTFSFAPSYLNSFRGGIAPNPTEFASKGIQLSRGFRALKVWLQLSSYGTDAIGRLIAQNIDQVEQLRDLIERDPNLEQVGPSEMNVVCFRYVSPELTEAARNEFNIELLVRVQESGIAVPSNAVIDGQFALRVAHTNHRTKAEDFVLLLETVVGIGAQMLQEDPRQWQASTPSNPAHDTRYRNVQ